MIAALREIGRRRTVSVVLLVALVVGCSDNDENDGRGDEGGTGDAGAAFDAGGDCWPVESSTAGGEVEIGTGPLGFEPMPEAVQFILGTQGGTFLSVHARLRGLEPGNPDDLLDPTNPRTRFSAVLFDGTEVARECPGTVGYEPSEENSYFERKRAQNLEFLPFELGQKAFDTDITLIVEVIDAQGRYARDEKTAFAQAPEGWTDGDAGPPDAGNGDAGPADAAPADAGAPDAGARPPPPGT
jgi:hypothetical protein